jgi:hypothetical protein
MLEINPIEMPPLITSTFYLLVTMRVSAVRPKNLGLFLTEVAPSRFACREAVSIQCGAGKEKPEVM